MKITSIFIVLMFLFSASSVSAQRKRAVQKPTALSAREIAAKVLPSVVLIITQDENGNPIAQGSGFVYKPGLVVSNLHVFERATNAVVKNVKTGEISKAIEVVGMNAREDICIIRIDNAKFPVIAIGDSHQVKTGDDIYVASNPKGLEGSFTKGIVSGVREQDRGGKGDDENFVGETDRTLFQIDAAISPGSSGGVLINTKAEAIGIIKSSIVSGQNLNFAIPVEQLVKIPQEFNDPIKLAGSCALSGWAEWGLNGRVKIVWEDGVIIRYDEYGNEVAREFNGKAVLFTFDLNRLPTSRTEKEGGRTIRDVRYDREEAIEIKLDRRISAGEERSSSDGITTTFNRFGEIESIVLADTKTTNDFDNDGRVVRKRFFVNDILNSETRYEYKDDRFGNWIEKYEYKRDSSNPTKWVEESKVRREIEYYD